MNRFLQLLAMVATLVIGAFSGAHANIMQLSESGTGQVLLFPYYSARNGSSAYLSLVNTTAQGKAVRVNFREARSGFVIQRLNVYLSAKDVWNVGIFNDVEGATLSTLDKSCTSPRISNQGLPFSAAAYQTQVNESRDRTREGFVEVIEMASIPNIRTTTATAITHSAGVPSCNQNITDPAYEPPATDLTPPSGGLTGTLTLLSITQGMLASSAAVAIENFWASGTGAPTPRVYAANDTAPDLTSGGNVWARISAVSIDAPAVLTSQSLSSRPDTYIARFASSIDAVSALLTKSSLSTEYAYTRDNVIATSLIVTFPTKPYYIRTANLGMFQSPWNSDTAKSCDSFSYSSTDREEYATVSSDLPGAPQPPVPQMCFVANLVRFGGGWGQPTADATYLGSLIAIEVLGHQSQGADVLTAGKEGGWAELSWVKSTAALDTREATIYRTDAGKLVATSTNIRLIGLPAIGFTLSQSGYKTGSPQQNFADATPMRSMLAATPVP